MTEPTQAHDAVLTPAPPPRGNRFWTILFGVSLLLLLLVLAFGAGLITERTLIAGGTLFERPTGPGGQTAVAPTTDEAFPQLTEIKELLQGEYFYRPTDPGAQATFAAQLDQNALAAMELAAGTPVASIPELRQQLEFAGITGMTSGLEDPFTVFLEPAVQAPIAEDLRGEYEGIGVIVSQAVDELTIVSVFPDSPAAAVGLQASDVLLAADGMNLVGMESADALQLIRGPAGSSVELTIGREGTEPFTVAVERRAIETPAVVYNAVADGRIAWIQVGIFGDKTTAQLDRALERAEEEQVDGIILDIRGNGGGWVVSAQEVIGRFVPADVGPALLEDLESGDTDPLLDISIENGTVRQFERPLVVLVDGGTASAAEIVAGALRVYKRAPLLGVDTFGKGSVQRVHDFPNGSSARITTARWLTPDGTPIPEDGLAPDIVVVASADLAAPDEQLAAAVRLLQGQPPIATPVASPVATPIAGQVRVLI